jgi:hypothetical protein
LNGDLNLGYSELKLDKSDASLGAAISSTFFVKNFIIFLAVRSDELP